MKTMTLKSRDDTNLYVAIWDDVIDPKGILMIAHGMAEHILRYEALANYLNEKGWIVAGHDHRGHGQSVKEIDEIGILAVSNGWDLLIDDMELVRKEIQSRYSQLPLYYFGHSMGSFALRHYIGFYGENLHGAILSGTGQNPLFNNLMAKQVAKLEAKLKGRDHRSTLMNKLSFGKFNRAFKPNRTEFDWLTRDQNEVDKYIADPLCGGLFTSGFYEDFLDGLLIVGNYSHVMKVPKDLPLLFISGTADPLSDQGKAVSLIAKMHENAGVKSVGMILFKGARHELTNEINRIEVFETIYKWLNSKI